MRAAHFLPFFRHALSISRGGLQAYKQIRRTPSVVGGGVRPSSGAEGFACVAQPVFTGARNLSQIAAPEDGRTPALLN